MADSPPSTTPLSRITIRSPDEILGMTFPDSHIILGPHVLSRGQNTAIVGPGGVGKSRMCNQLAICSIIERKFIGFTTHNPDLRWLILQVENDNRRLKFDMGFYKSWMTAEQWAKVNRQLFIHTLETDEDGFLSLDVARNRFMVAQAIGDLNPDVVCWDALYQFGWGDLNKDMDMFASLSEIGRLTRAGNPLRTPVTLHHALTGREGASKAIGWERAGYGRGSKALHQWCRLQINLAPGSEGGELVVVGAGKCSDSKEFPPFAVRLNPTTMIYEVEREFDVKSWRTDIGKKTAPAITDEEVAELCGADGLDKKQLAEAIEVRTGCSQATSYRAIERAQKRGRVRYIPQSEKYVLSTSGRPR